MYVNYNAVRTNVINKIMEESEKLNNTYMELCSTVSDITDNRYLIGTTAEKYNEEFENVISTAFKNINSNIENYAEELEALCQYYENEDNTMFKN